MRPLIRRSPSAGTAADFRPVPRRPAVEALDELLSLASAAMSTSPHTHFRRGRRVRTAGLLVSSAVAIVAAAAPATAAEPSSPAIDVPAAGSVVTCTSTGPLTATAGYLRERETTILDSRGDAHVLFTIAAEQVRLTAPDGRRYSLLGAGFDAVQYPTAAVTGPVLREQQAYTFAVVGRATLAGVVHFRSFTGADQIPHINDTSTCTLPGMGNTGNAS